jgi:hypothetical protein
MANPDLDGCVALGWTITAGRVTEAHLVEDTTGDETAVKCTVQAVRAMRFDPTITTTVERFSWYLSGL